MLGDLLIILAMLQPQKIRAILLDLDNTMYVYAPCNTFALQTSVAFLSKATRCPKQKIMTAFIAARQKVHRDLHGTAASHSRFLYFQKTIEILLGRADFTLIKKVHTLYWDAYFQKMTCHPSVTAFLSTAKQKKYTIVVVTDFTLELQYRKINYLGVTPFIDYIVSSEEVGHEKPHPAIFHCALEKSGVKKKEAIMIGDDTERDIHGAQKYGIHAILLKNPGNFTRLHRMLFS